jgi:Flp pilus assembly protein TadB
MTGDGTLTERVWMIAAGACVIVACVAMVWRWNVEVAFVAATLGVVCWFLNMRNRLKKSIVNEIKDDEDAGEEDDNQ